MKRANRANLQANLKAFRKSPSCKPNNTGCAFLCQQFGQRFLLHCTFYSIIGGQLELLFGPNYQLQDNGLCFGSHQICKMLLSL